MIRKYNTLLGSFFEDVIEFFVSASCNSPKNLQDLTENIFENRSNLLGKLALCLIKHNFSEYINQEYHDCDCCGKRVRKSPKLVKKVLETKIGTIELERPYFYCKCCRKGQYPLDQALGLAEGKIQYDVQSLEAWLTSHNSYEQAQETYRRCTGQEISAHHMFETTNCIAKNIDVIDASPKAEEIQEVIKEHSKGKFRRPVIMIAVDGAHAPTRPEPSPRKGKRGKGEWREAKGFRIYLIDHNKIVHLISWHQILNDDDLALALQAVKEASLIPEEKVRLAIIGDGARWIWNKISVIFPTAKRVLDYYHCSEHVFEVANIRYGKGAKSAHEWAQAILTRIFFDQLPIVVRELEQTPSKTDESKKKIDDLIGYLRNNSERIKYRAARKGGYHIGSGAIESANKFISHTRLKLSGAWWYPSCANNILKLRCACQNNTFDRNIENFVENDQARIRRKSSA